MAIEVRTYEGDARELAPFINASWKSYYTEKFAIPELDANYLDWEFFAKRDESREFRLAAYQGSRLIGCFLAECFPFEVNGRQLDGTLGSWFTIDPEFHRTPAAFKLVNEMERRHKNHGKTFLLGYVFRDRRAVSAKFWSAYGRAFPAHFQVIGGCGTWIRVLNPKDIAAKSGDLGWRTGLRCLGVVQRGAPKWEAKEAVRDYRPSDLDACLELCEQELRGFALSHTWGRERLDLQIGCSHQIPRTLVFETKGAVQGFVNYHRTMLRSRGVIPIGLIDLFVGKRLLLRDRIGLLAEAMRRMLSEGMDMAIVPRFNFEGAETMIACGYFPSPKIFHVARFFCDEPLHQGKGSVGILLR